MITTQSSRKYAWARACLALGAAALVSFDAAADERLFTYSYSADNILPKGGLEFEQWATARLGRKDRVYSRWDLRSELEYGVTDRYTTALYLNLRSTREDFEDPAKTDVSRFEFKGLSWENKYQLLNPNLAPVGVLIYGEVTSDGTFLELEEKLILSKNFGDNWTVALNGIVEEEWEYKGGGTEEELSVALTAGVSYRLTSHWAIGLEAMHVRDYVGGINFNQRESIGYYVGPNVHYGSDKWWATLTVMPQVSGSPEASGELDLAHRERVQVRLITGFNF